MMLSPKQILLRCVMAHTRGYVHTLNLQSCDLLSSLFVGINFHMFIQMLEIDACGRCCAILCAPAMKCTTRSTCREMLFPGLEMEPVRASRVRFIYVVSVNGVHFM